MAYNPGIQSRAGEIFASTLAQAGQSIGQGVSDGIRQYRQKKDEKEGTKAVVQYAMKNGWVEDEAEGMAAVKAAGGYRPAMFMLNQLQEQKQKEEMEKRARAQEQEAMEREAAARRYALAPTVGQSPARGPLSLGGFPNGAPPTTEPTAEDAVRRYLAADGNDATTLSGLKSLPGAPAAPRPAPRMMNIGTDASGRPVEGIFDGNNFSRIAPAAQDGDSPQSPQGKLLADADRLAKAGRPIEAEALRKAAVTEEEPRLNTTQQFQLASIRDLIARKAIELDEVEAKINNGSKGFFSANLKQRDKLIKEIAATEDRLQRKIDSFKNPLAGPKRAAPAAASAMSAQDRQAMEWARANPDDPRAAEILARLARP